MSELREIRTVGGLAPAFPFVRDARAAFSVWLGPMLLGVVFAHLGAGGGRWSAYTPDGSLVTNRALTREAALERLLERIDA